MRVSSKVCAGVAFLLLLGSRPGASGRNDAPEGGLRINEEGYYENHSVNVMVFDDFYPEGHQGGFTVVQCGRRLAANGDLRLEPTPGQWSPVPKVGERVVDPEKGTITVSLWYPDSARDRKGFNPIEYPDLRLSYSITTVSQGNSIQLTVDLAQSLPDEWGEKVGFNLELFPAEYFGEHYLMDGESGLFPRQPNGPMRLDGDGELQPTPLATGRHLVVAPGRTGKEISFQSNRADLQLLDGRGLHANGWFTLRSTVPAGATTGAVEWIITAPPVEHWRYRPVIQVSQVGYHPRQKKLAYVELDRQTETYEPVELIHIDRNSERVLRADPVPVAWGNFLRYRYLLFDFSTVGEEGLYAIRYGDVESHRFEIRADIYARDVWQPTLEYFLPVQMCHMTVRDRYKVWHGLCHMDDARMAPVHLHHFDGYVQGDSTLTPFAPGDHVPGLNKGGWHDAGDYDLRVESQAGTVYKLALAMEFFGNGHDQTTVDQEARLVEIHVPDGSPDMLQQIEHGVLSILGGYRSMGRLYRGIICPTLRQYVHLGDASTMTDNRLFEPDGVDPILGRPLPGDDRWVFTEKNPRRELLVAQVLAAACRVLREHSPELARECLQAAESLYRDNSSAEPGESIGAAAELYLSTSAVEYEDALLWAAPWISDNLLDYGEVIGRVVEKLDNADFTAQVEHAVTETSKLVAEEGAKSPYGIPYTPAVWGAGWRIQSLGVKHLFLHLGFPRIFPADHALNALNFMLGCHPGENTASLVSGTGVHSLTVAYGVNRDEWSYIPGGVASGTGLVRPDLPELKVWPYLWQQTEYVVGGGGSNFIILAMGADSLLNRE